MSLRPASGPVGDPFFAPVRRRHPDLDLILLPPEAPEAGTATPAQPGAEEALATDRAAVSAAAGQLLASDPAPGPATLSRGTRPGTVRARVRIVVHEPTSPLDRLAEVSLSLGWRVHRTSGPVDRLVSRSDDGPGLEATYADNGTLVVEVTGPDRAVGASRVRSLVGGR